ncbi:MAG TPA: peptide ligase PGM1-related protein [Solirubrobacteraceae bacterium]
MSTPAALQSKFSPRSLDAATAQRRFAYPTVRPLASVTAHPSGECWPTAENHRRPNGAIRSDRPPIIRRPPLRLITGENTTLRPATLDASSRFDALQRRMAAVEAAARAGRPRALVIVPSRTVDKWSEPPTETQAYEERLLCSLLELADPALRMTYVTSAPIAPPIIDYYLSLLPRRVRRDARSRLSLVALGDGTARPLSQKLVERPHVLERIRRGISGTDASYLVPYNTTELERDVAIALGIPMYGADPGLSHLGTKSGCRGLFARAGVPHPIGREGITSVAGALEAIMELRRSKPALNRVVMKLNQGVSGEGNALIDLEHLPEPGSPDEADAVAQRIGRLAPEAAGVTPAAFLTKLSQMGGVVEEWITATELRSPSVQLQITPAGELQLLSTHDQILGGPSGQSYLGCRFPAEPSYAAAISQLAGRIGEHLVSAGVIGRCAIDFVVARSSSGWEPYAIELNLRKGGTTHPYETLVRLTGGSYDAAGARFLTPTGEVKHYLATDHLESPELRVLGRDGLLALTRRSDLRFDRLRRQGVVFHMLSSLDALGRAGLTAIAGSHEEAAALYDRTRTTLLEAAGRARSGHRVEGHVGHAAV